MSEIEGGNGLGANPFRDRDNHGVDEPEPQRAVLPADGVRANDILLFPYSTANDPSATSVRNASCARAPNSEVTR